MTTRRADTTFRSPQGSPPSVDAHRHRQMVVVTTHPTGPLCPLRRPLRLAALTAVLAAALVLLVGSPAAAQATPVATPAQAASAADCRAEPRPLEDFAAITDATPGSFAQQLDGTPLATAVPPTVGEPADPEVVQRITATLEQIGACTATTDVRRFSALWTDDLFRRSLSGVDLSNVLTATPVPNAQPVPLPVIDSVRVLPDGRVAVVGGPEGGPRGVLVFVESDGRYLLDDSFDLTPNGTPVP